MSQELSESPTDMFSPEASPSPERSPSPSPVRSRRRASYRSRSPPRRRRYSHRAPAPPVRRPRQRDYRWEADWPPQSTFRMFDQYVSSLTDTTYAWSRINEIDRRMQSVNCPEDIENAFGNDAFWFYAANNGTLRKKLKLK